MQAHVNRLIQGRHLTRSALLAVSCLAGIASAHAKGGVIRLPVGVAPLPALGAPAPLIPPPVFAGNDLGQIHAFTVAGFIQDATVSSVNCPGLPASQWGGTVTVNGLTITVPCNLTMQMPAATFTWADLLTPANGKFATTGKPADFTLPKNGNGIPFPSMEINVTGNIVGGEYIAGLILVSQQSVNIGQGYIVGINNANGSLLVASSASATAARAELQINDPAARFSIGHSPDTRFAVDDQNPTIHSSTGYPMCIPRVAPPYTATNDDQECPARNRPLAANGCRNFGTAGIVLPTGRELTPPGRGQIYCTSFVMPAPAKRLPSEPDAFKQVPFAIGDYITWQGTLIRSGKGGTPDFISVHTIEANVGVYTQPGTLPVYIAIGDFGLSADAPATFNGIPQEAQDRIFLEANVTDVTSIVDIYLMDFDPAGKAGQRPVNRWITPATMTGGVGAPGSNGQIIDGGITTQFVGPQPGRARIRAGKATPGILLSPTRYIRVAVRQLCDPANINKTAPLVVDPKGPPVVASTQPCLERAPAANGIMSGQYFAPVFEYIFPENVTPGDPIVANNFWALDFLVRGEGEGTGPLIPTPW